jgi:hypothetical protein
MHMQKVIRHILYLNGMAEAFDTTDDFHLRLLNSPFLPLVVERHDDEVSITHYVEQQGDLLRDPEMVLSLREWARHSGAMFTGWVPKSTEPGGFGHVYPTGKIVHDGDDVPRLHYHPRRMKEALSFAAMWARNLREQGFVKRYAGADIASLTHPRQLAQALTMDEAPIRITHRVTQCSDGAEFHAYTFPDDLPPKLRQAAYRQAEAALKADWPNWSEFGFAVTGQGMELRTRGLPPCACGE